MPEEMRYGLKNKNILVREEYQRALVEVLQITKRLETDLDRFYFMTAINFFTDQYDKGKSYIDKLSYSAHIDLFGCSCHS